jgi:hypothetical protein
MQSSICHSILEALTATFLPEDFPHSVPRDYLPFQAWDTLQAVCSYVRGMLCTQAVMRGIGVGSDHATAYGAVFMFAVRDLTGMLGGIAFAHAQGSGFDGCAKQWRLFADVTNDLAMALDLASPLFPKAFLLMACLGSLARAMTSVAGGATRAALTQHFARSSGRAADVAAKEQSQETAVTIVGMLIGMVLIRMCKESQALVWSSFVILTWLHIWANVKAIRSLVLTSLNRPRLDAMLRREEVVTPEEMKSIEDLTPPPLVSLVRSLHIPFVKTGDGQSPKEIKMGVSLTWLSKKLSGGNMAVLLKLAEDQKEERYLVMGEEGKLRSCQWVILHKEATPRDVIQAYCHAYFAGIEGMDARAGAERFVEELERAGWDVDGRNSIVIGKCAYHEW